MLTSFVPRPEHPQPQFQRSAWENLNGPWEFQFDDENIGLSRNWQITPPEKVQPILVPFSFETSASGISETGFHPQVWYWRKFEMPDAWAGKHLLLHFGAVDYRATVWVNGQYAGAHEGGHTPFALDITKLLDSNGNTITVRVEAPPDDRSIPRGKQFWENKPASIYYMRTTGIWQTVWIEAVPAIHMERARIHPQNDGTVLFDAKLSKAAIGARLDVTISRDGQVVSQASGVCQDSEVAAAAFVSEPQLWSPESPALYDVKYELHVDDVIDTVHSYFGYRTVETNGGRLLLNGNAVYLKTILDQGYWPESNLTPPTDEAIQFDIRQAKDLGFNGVRKHQKIEDPRFYYWADKMGLLVSAEMPSAYIFDNDAVGRVTREWMDAVNRDYNHPSIIIWVPINESWGVPDLKEKRQQAHLKSLYFLTKSLDPTRLVIDNDGWEHTDCTDLFAIHDYTETGAEILERFQSVPEGAIPIPKYGQPYLAPGQTYNGAPLFLSEFGGVGYVLPEDARNVPDNSWGYSGIEKRGGHALERMRGLFEAIAKVPAIMGICYTQLYDVEQEINGLLTYDRRPKFDAGEIRSMNALLA